MVDINRAVLEQVLKVDNKVGGDRIVDISKEDYERIPKRLLFSQMMPHDNLSFLPVVLMAGR